MCWIHCRHLWLFGGFRLIFFFSYSLKSFRLSSWWSGICGEIKRRGGESTRIAKKTKMTDFAIANLNGSSLMVTSEHCDAIRDNNNNPARGFTAYKKWFKKVLTPPQAQYIFIEEAHWQLKLYSHWCNINPKVLSRVHTAQRGRMGRRWRCHCCIRWKIC